MRVQQYVSNLVSNALKFTLTGGVEISVAAALTALEQAPFDLVLVDMHMPVMDGPMTIRNIRANERALRSAPVIAWTADAMSGEQQRYLAMGMDGYLAKPLDERTRLAEIARVTSGLALPREHCGRTFRAMRLP